MRQSLYHTRTHLLFSQLPLPPQASPPRTLALSPLRPEELAQDRFTFTSAQGVLAQLGVQSATVMYEDGDPMDEGGGDEDVEME